MKDATTPRQDVYTRVTDRIVAALEQGVRPWHQPWSVSHAAGRITLPLRHNGVPYAGINVLMLWGAAVAAGYASPIWMTFRQALELGAHVRKGEKGSLVVYANKITRTEADETTGEEIEREIPFLKGYTVFNVEQIDGLPRALLREARAALRCRCSASPHAESFFAATGADIRHGGGLRLLRHRRTTTSRCRPSRRSATPRAYYATLAHEATHWTRHPTRLDRDFGRKRCGDEGYAMEELVAELGRGLPLRRASSSRRTPRDDHATYIAHWLDGPERRQARDLHRRRARAARRRLPAQAAGSESRGRLKAVSCGTARSSINCAS